MLVLQTLILRHKSGPEYVALKVYVNDFDSPPELSILHHLRSIQSKDVGRQHVRQLRDSFTVEGPHGAHTCLVHDPLGMSLAQVMRKLSSQLLEREVLRYFLRRIIGALGFLHEQAKVIHSG